MGDDRSEPQAGLTTAGFHMIRRWAGFVRCQDNALRTRRLQKEPLIQVGWQRFAQCPENLGQSCSLDLETETQRQFVGSIEKEMERMTTSTFSC